MNIQIKELVMSDQELQERLDTAGTEKLFKVFISQGGDATYVRNDIVNPGDLYKSHTPEAWQLAYIRDNMVKLERHIDLNFQEVSNIASADVIILIHPAPSKDSVNGSFGLNQPTPILMISHASGLGSPYYLETDPTKVIHNQSSKITQENIFRHELGHVLGLEHPWDSEDGDFAVNEWSDKHEPTRMGYNEHLSAEHDWFEDIDISALQSIWGINKEQDIPLGFFQLIGAVVKRSDVAMSDVDVVISDTINTNTYKTNAQDIFLGVFAAGSTSEVNASLTYLNSTKAISSQDALDALKLSVGLTTSSGSKTAFDYISADFNQDGKVSSQDALSILKYSVGLPTPEQAKWVFVDTNGDYSGVSKSNTSYTEGLGIADLSIDTSVSLTGILIGDVNDSYSGLIA